MNNFYFGSVSEPQDTKAPPTEKFREFVTLKEIPGNDVRTRMALYIENAMKTIPYFVHSESDFDYCYQNEANGIRQLMRGWVCTIDYTSIGKRCRKDFIFRFLPSPLYEIEKQKEHDYEEMKRLDKMRIKEMEGRKAPPVPEEQKPKPKYLSDDELIKSFQKAKAMAEQNSSVPPTLDSFNLIQEPVVIPLDENNKIKEEQAKKEAKDEKIKDKEWQMLNAELRNKAKLKSLVVP